MRKTGLDWKSIRCPVVLILLFNATSCVSFCQAETGAYFSPFLLVVFIAVICTFADRNQHYHLDKWQKILIVIGSVLFSLILVLAHFVTIRTYSLPRQYMAFLSLALGGYAAANVILKHQINSVRINNHSASQCTKHSPRKVFLFSFILIGIINLFGFVIFFPGILTIDSVNQISQCLSGTINNNHPFFHTLLIKLFLDTGLALFGDINIAIGAYTLFQLLCMTGIFSYCISTIYIADVSRRACVLVIVWFALFPGNFWLNITMWKDILFSGGVLLLLTTLFRIFNGITEGKRLNTFFVVVASFMMCLFRNNGIIAYIVALTIFLLMFKFQFRKELLLMISVLFIVIILQAVLIKLNVAFPDSVETLSLPLQQVARVIADNNELTQEQTIFIENIVNPESVKKTYLSFISDPIKSLILNEGNMGYISQHKSEFISFWFRLGLEYPEAYLSAWIDQTKGYWYCGYDYWAWTTGIVENGFGIEQKAATQPIKDVLLRTSNLFFNGKAPALELFTSLGLYTWLTVDMLIVSLAFKRRDSAFLTVPPLAIIFTLMLGTPVYNEFRYAYALTICIPLIIISAYSSKETLLEIAPENGYS